MDDKKQKQKEADKKYRESHKEEIALRRKQYNEKRKDEIAINNKKYREEHKEQIKEYRKTYYEANKEKLQAQCQEYRDKNRMVYIWCDACGYDLSHAAFARHKRLYCKELKQ